MTDETKFDLKNDPTFKQLVAVVSAMGVGQKQTQAQLTELGGMLKERLNGAASGSNQNDDDKQMSEDEFNEMKPSELMKHISKVVADVVEKKVDLVRKDMSSLSNDVTEKTAKQELQAFAKENPGLYHFVDEVKALIEETPGLSFERAYKLARAENPDKAKDVDAQIARESGKTDDEVKEKKLPFGGLTPTSGSTVGEDGKEVKMTSDDAAAKAWEETLEAFPLLSNTGE